MKTAMVCAHVLNQGLKGERGLFDEVSGVCLYWSGYSLLGPFVLGEEELQNETPNDMYTQISGHDQ